MSDQHQDDGPAARDESLPPATREETLADLEVNDPEAVQLADAIIRHLLRKQRRPEIDGN
jgi:hypothetical protein